MATTLSAEIDVRATGIKAAFCVVLRSMRRGLTIVKVSRIRKSEYLITIGMKGSR